MAVDTKEEAINLVKAYIANEWGINSSDLLNYRVIAETELCFNIGVSILQSGGEDFFTVIKNSGEVTDGI